MKIYYTLSEGNHIKRLETTISFEDAVKELEKNRRKELDYERTRELGEAESELCGQKIHSVFFVRDNKSVFNIWDASLNGFRPNESFKNMRISW